MLILMMVLMGIGFTIRLIVLENMLNRLRKKYNELYEEHRPLAIELRDTDYSDDLTQQIEEAHNVWKYGEHFDTVIALQEFEKFLIENKNSICSKDNRHPYTDINFFDNFWVHKMARQHSKDIKYHMTWYAHEQALEKTTSAIKNIDKSIEYKCL